MKLVWEVVYQYAGGQTRTIPAVDNCFHADPFTRNNVIFLEEYSYKKEKGYIVAYKVDMNNEPVRLGVVLEEEFHLSFPYMFSYAGGIWMVPESHKAGEIRLYKCVKFPLEWEFVKVLVQLPAADSVLFPGESKWYMLTNLGDFNNELHMYTADNPLSDWVKLNGPVVVGNHARNGGLIIKDTAITRVAQNQGKVYGESYSLNRIDNIYPYKETKMSHIYPKSGYDATHHLCIQGDLTVWDQAKLCNPYKTL